MNTKGVTLKGVQGAIDAIKQQGQTPTNERIRQHLGTGSYSTINRHLKVLSGAGSGEPGAAPVVLPPDIRERGIKMITEIFGTCDQAASARIELHHADSEARVARKVAALESAEQEIARLEAERDELMQQLARHRDQELVLVARAARAEALIEERQRQLDTALESLKTALDATAVATTEAAHLRGQLMQLNDAQPLR